MECIGQPDIQKGGEKLIRIAIVEDDQYSAFELRKMLEQYAREHNLSFQIQIYTDGLAFLDTYQCRNDIVFLDIEMPYLDGMKTAHRLRRLDENVCLIFVTNIAQYALEGYLVRAAGFFVKPISYYQMSAVLQRVIKQIKKTRESEILLGTLDGIFRINLSDILYIEVMGHLLYYHLFSGTLTVRSTMKEAEARFAPLGFARCNQCYLVNLDYVESIQSDFLIVNGTELKFSRSRRKDFLRQLTDYLGGVL